MSSHKAIRCFVFVCGASRAILIQNNNLYDTKKANFRFLSPLVVFCGIDDNKLEIAGG